MFIFKQKNNSFFFKLYSNFPGLLAKVLEQINNKLKSMMDRMPEKE